MPGEPLQVALPVDDLVQAGLEEQDREEECDRGPGHVERREGPRGALGSEADEVRHRTLRDGIVHRAAESIPVRPDRKARGRRPLAAVHWRVVANLDALLDALWLDHVDRNPEAPRIRDLLEARGERIENDHVALRTFAGSRTGLTTLLAPLLGAGYRIAGTYAFPEKKLDAVHCEHPERGRPKVFASELRVAELSPRSRAVVDRLLDPLPDPAAPGARWGLLEGERPWSPRRADHALLAGETEYGAWVAAHGICANHFTVLVNALRTFDGIRDLVAFLLAEGVTLNERGGIVKGDRASLLEQASTVAPEVEIRFADGRARVPGAYTEFAQRHPGPDGRIFQGFPPRVGRPDLREHRSALIRGPEPGDPFTGCARLRAGDRTVTQGQLLRERRYAPHFWGQFLGAFGDNLFRNALAGAIASGLVARTDLAAPQVAALLGGLFILPFFLVSGIAGQLADRVEKRRLIVWIRGAEIPIALGAAIGFATASLPLLLGSLLLSGIQSAFYGPVKYSILPELLDDDELVGGNALVASSTFVGILLGALAGTWLGPTALGGALVGVAVAGLGASLGIPRGTARNPDLVITGPLSSIRQTWAITAANRTVLLSVLGISWFWFLGLAFLALIPELDAPGTATLGLFCAGIAVGALLCERLSGRKTELGLVPFGSFGITMALLDLGLLAPPSGLHLRIALALLAVFGGLFVVPLYALVQSRPDPGERSRVLAGNNILNAAFMILGSGLLYGAVELGIGVRPILVGLAVLNALAAAYIYTVIPEFLLRLVVWGLANVLYRIRIVGREKLPLEGPAILAPNHVSFVDWLLMASASRHPARFVMDHSFMSLPVVGFLFRDAKVIPIAPARESRETMEAAFDTIARELDDGQIVCIFPEGRITHDGTLNVFRPGIERIVSRNPCPVYPVAIKGMWGSFFSREGGGAMQTRPRRFWSRVEIEVGDPIPAGELRADDLGRRVAALGGWAPPAPPDPKPSG